MRTLVRLAAAVLVAALGLAALVVGVVPELSRMVHAHHEEALPLGLADFTTLARRSFMYDSAGNPIDVLNVENAEPFTLDKVPKPVIDAVLAVEDAGFYQHKGVNAKGLIRAALANLSAGGTTQGGSTITQQLVKNALVGAKRDANRKILEAAYALRLEKKLTKDQILEQYLNRIYLGNNAYGLQAAAETYFGKDVTQLGQIEGAFLAGLIRNPVGYDPIYRAERSRQRFKEALARLVATKELDKTAAASLGDTWPLPDTLKKTAKVDVARTYFSEEVRRLLLDKTNILGNDYQQRYNQLFRGGLKIYTTLDPRVQTIAEQSVHDQVPDTNGRFETAVTMLDTKTGAIRAMVGGPGFSQNSQVNLATTARQTGSSVKGFILTAAMAAGIQPNDVIDGENNVNCHFWHKPPAKEDPYIQDTLIHSESGRIDHMTWNSVNCAFIRMYFSVGGKRVIAMAHAMGVKGKLDDVFAFATGANEISPLDMAAGYSTLANSGQQNDPYYIERIEGPDGQVVYQHEGAPKQVITAEVSDQTVDILKGVIRSGTATRAQLGFERPAAGKTGTYESDKHAWFVGFTPQYTAAVYMGNPKFPEPMQGIPEFVNAPAPFERITNVQGGTYPARVWKELMDNALSGVPFEDWAPPPPPKRPPARVFAPDQDCVGTFVAAPPPDPNADPSADPATADTEAPKVVAIRTPTTLPFAPTDFNAPAATVPSWAYTFSCKVGAVAASGVPAPTTTRPTAVPATTTTVGGPVTTKPPATTATTTPVTAPSPTTPPTSTP